MVLILIDLDKTEDEFISHKKIDWGLITKQDTIRKVIREAVKRQSKGKTRLKTK